MNEFQLVIIIFGTLLLFLLSGVWIGVGIGMAGVIAMLIFTGYPVGKMVAALSMGSLNSFVLVCLPGFILMGEILFRSGASKDLYTSISPWVVRIPGKLLHSNIISCTLFAALSGSSAATAATIGTVAVPELKRLGYQPGMVAGSLAGAGTLGLLIPPSIALIVYGVITNNSIGQLYMAGFFPGFMLALLFMLYIAIASLIQPNLVSQDELTYTWKDRFMGLLKILPTAGLIFMVLGLIYLGVSTPTEAAMIGVAGAILAAVFYKTFTLKMLWESMMGTIRTSCMLFLIMMMASILSSAVAYLRIPTGMARIVSEAGLSPGALFVMVSILYIILGCFFDGMSIMLLTLPIIYPLMVNQMQFNPIWFGVILTILIEVAQVTPPVGFNLYVIQHVSGQPITTVARYSLPFILILILGVVLLYFFPEIALYLPQQMVNQ
jgi:tripartite ATP-independent transporter DctM subunit